MAPARNASQDQPLQISRNSRDQFVFPKNSHLLITTPSQIYSWDSTGIHTVFRSTKNGIVTASETQDGSGTLAVANKHVVILHDTKRGHEKSWGLDANEDEVRHLQYTTDAQSLLLSTSLTSDIQHYSVEQARLLSPTKAHASPPVALAVSPSGHLMVSASDGPPAIYLKNLTHNSAPILIEPRASKAGVTVAAFHPERPNIFLLAFRDGSIAAYDANKIMRSTAGAITDQESVNKGEISHITSLHRAVPVRNKARSITDAAFLPGFKTRAVTVGSDGRCRIIDFADAGVVLRTWHAKAPVASVSVLSPKAAPQARNESNGSVRPHPTGRSAETNNLIAIGRTDGLIHIYDSVGLLLCERAAGENGEKIISVRWARGPSPNPIVERDESESTDQKKMLPQKEPHLEPVPPPPASRTSPATESTIARRETLFEHVGLPPALRKPKSPSAKRAPNAPPRQFTIHPDEVDESTVRRTVLTDAPEPIPVAKGDYLDLFSPVRPPDTETLERVEKRVVSPPRSRPALTSQTFVESPEPEPTTQRDTLTRQRNLALFPSTDSGCETAREVEKGLQAQLNTSFKTSSPFVQKKRITFKDSSCRNSRRNSSFKATTAPVNSNAKVLAEIRKMSNIHLAYRSQGTLSNLGPTKTSNEDTMMIDTKTQEKNAFTSRPNDHIDTHLGSEEAFEAYEHAHKRRHWSEDSTQEPAPLGDIWLTSESEKDAKPSRRRKQFHIARPLARQTSRSRVDSGGPMGTLAQQPADIASASAQRLHRMDGSTEDEMFTAATHVTSNGTLSPSSADIQHLFPRTSSLSPRKCRKSKKEAARSPKAQDKNLREVAPNVAGRVAKSPWARARAGKKAQNLLNRSIGRTPAEPVEVFYDPECAVQNETLNASHCASCVTTNAKVQELENQVSRLKGEILVCKAMLRRQGVLLPGNYNQSSISANLW